MVVSTLMAGDAVITRRGILAATGELTGLAAGVAAGQTPAVTTQGRNEAMQITRGGSQASRPGSTEYFTVVLTGRA